MAAVPGDQWYLQTVHQFGLSVGVILRTNHQAAQKAQSAIRTQTCPRKQRYRTYPEAFGD